MPHKFLNLSHRKRWIILLLVVLVPLGILTKFYAGPASDWVNFSLGGILYVIFWSLVGGFFFEQTKSWKIALWVFGITAMLEIMQLWHPPFLETLRSTFLGASLLGNYFSWLDFPHYLLGFLISWGILYLLRPRIRENI
jgi:hypothetical protein